MGEADEKSDYNYINKYKVLIIYKYVKYVKNVNLYKYKEFLFNLLFIVEIRRI